MSPPRAVAGTAPVTAPPRPLALRAQECQSTSRFLSPARLVAVITREPGLAQGPSPVRICPDYPRCASCHAFCVHEVTSSGRSRCPPAPCPDQASSSPYGCLPSAPARADPRAHTAGHVVHQLLHHVVHQLL